jgi:hypothetical protein
VGYLHLCASYLETYRPSLLHFIRTKTMNFYIMCAINIFSDSCRLAHTGSSADERWGWGAGANYRDPAVCNGARGPIVVHTYHYLSNAQINPFRPSLSYSATENQYFRFSVNIFSRSALAGGTIPPPPPTEPALGGPGSRFQTVQTYFWITKATFLLHY